MLSHVSRPEEHGQLCKRECLLACFINNAVALPPIINESEEKDESDDLDDPNPLIGQDTGDPEHKSGRFSRITGRSEQSAVTVSNSLKPVPFLCPRSIQSLCIEWLKDAVFLEQVLENHTGQTELCFARYKQ
ncbi:hypothetical protein IMY05_011G0101400 [Salix suchowensis]|nr:hypothetical protein IMY05_011G0101400 [Salix suchowensis]